MARGLNYDLVIKVGTVIDGLKTPRYCADISILSGKIVEIGGNIPVSDAKRVIDAAGKIVAPGVVDLHTHYDNQIFWDPWCTISGVQGGTRVVIGNCGIGYTPYEPEDRGQTVLLLVRNEAVPLATMRQGMPRDWVTFKES
jgi:N-acyl-D-amino-acid deacylase